jgi:hypothetical protein
MDANTQECTDTLVLNELQRGQRDRQKLTQSVLLECGGQISLLRFAMTVGLTYLMTHHTNAYNTPNDPTVDDPTNRYALRLIGEAINRYTSQQE